MLDKPSSPIIIPFLYKNSLSIKLLSNKEADIYETNLMRRLAGLLYIDSKIMGDIKEEIKNENLK